MFTSIKTSRRGLLRAAGVGALAIGAPSMSDRQPPPIR